MKNQQLHTFNTRAERIARKVNDLGFNKNGKPMIIDQAWEVLALEEGVRNAHTLRSKMKNREEPVLEQEAPEESGRDYRLKEGKTGCWIKIGVFSVHLYLTDEGIVSDVFANGEEDESIASTYAFFNEAEEKVCELDEIDIDDVAEWVGLHYARNFDAESPTARIDWIHRYKEAHDKGEQTPEAFCVYSPNEAALANSDGGWWSNEFGWVDYHQATVFDRQERKFFNLPISTGGDAHWVLRTPSVAEKLECSGCSLPTQVDDDGLCNQCAKNVN